ncbi:MAG: hypothetical protein LHW64_07020 [Candidatus Cloacimonetes bacterium]|jgi:hypothetical protein|nr:hypothetical protein [Candidatus Cloacimonadota bacterium]MCK9584943.1 hypothetical protein [Candidatus Cloacimonadota bacterium]MDY0229859.1 hypothetical protein [Candidatus Cloacimonadaceae bacterium]
MFYVSDTYESRRKRILEFKNEQNICIAILLASADFEWTIRRIMLSLSEIPNTIIRNDKKYLFRCSGHGKYKEVWNKLIKPNTSLINPINSGQGLSLSEVIPNWEAYKTALDARHRIIHGIKPNAKFEDGSADLDCILDATDHLIRFSNVNGYDVYSRIKVKKVKK